MQLPRDSRRGMAEGEKKKRWRVRRDSKKVGGILVGSVATRTGALELLPPS